MTEQGTVVDVSPARRVHRGHARVHGLVFTRDDASARAAILSRLAPGDWVARRDGGLVLLFARPEHAALDSLPALAIVSEDGVLTTAPLSPGERLRAQDGGAGAIATMLDGALSVTKPSVRVDPAGWIDVSGLAIETPASLGAPPPPVAAPTTPRGAREALGVAAASAESLALRRALLAPAGSDGAGPAATTPVRPARPARWRALVQAALERAAAAARWLARTLAGASPGASRPALPPGAARSSALAPSTPRPPGLLSRLEAWLRDRLRRLGWQSLGRFLARKHAEHLQKLLALLEGNDLDEALRHAIPLSNEQGGEASAPSMSLPSPRTDLAISNVREKTGGALGLGPGLFAHLRLRYRALYERLLALGRPKDAAFVLAELLDDALGAVALLEKHGFVREAAELAEGRKLPPPVVVRQWLLARDLPRAIEIARRHDAFAPAIARLRTSDREAARALALAWADLRARSGDYVGALASLEAGDAIERARGLAARWAERGAAVGGAHGADALVWWLALDGDAPAQVAPRLESLLRDASLEERHVRQALYAALAKRRGTRLDAISDAARFAWRAAVRDRALFGEPALAQLLELEGVSRDGTIAADRPVITPLARRRLESLAAPLVVSPSGRGAFEVRDAALLPDRRVLVALGEAGLRVLAKDGRTVASFDVPADTIVLSDEGTRALVLSSRGTLTVVHRIDTVSRRAGDRFELLGLSAFARSFDGERWAVALDQVGQVMDVTRAEPRALFRLDRERVASIDRSPGFVSFVIASAPSASASGLERLRYEERGLVLRDRRALPERFGMEGRLYGVARFEPEVMHLLITQTSYYVTEGLVAYPGARELPGRPRGEESLAVAAGWLAVAVVHPSSEPSRAPIEVVVLDRAEQRARLVVPIDRGQGVPVEAVGLRLQPRRGAPPALVVFDAVGRVIAIELDEGRVLADLGVR